MKKPSVVQYPLFFCLIAVIACRLEARTWTSAQGKYKIEAEFVEHRQDGKVILRKADKTLIAVDLTKLSQADQQYVAELKAAANTPSGSLNGLLLASRILLRDGRISEANAKIGEASVKATGADKQRVDATRELAAQLTKFWTAVAEAGSRLRSGAEMEIGRARVVVVEASAERLVIRALGKNCRFALDRPETIPSSLALVLAKQRLVGSDASKIISAFESLEPETNNRRLWELAAGGPLVTRPLSEFGKQPPPGTEPTPYGNSVTTKPPTVSPLDPMPNSGIPQFGAAKKREPVPDGAEVAKKRKEIHELFADDFKAATAKEKYELAKKLFQLAQETLADEPAAAYVLYEEAAELAAGVGDANGAIQILEQINDSFDDAAIVSREAAALAEAIRVTDPQLAPQTIKFIGERAFQLIDKAMAAEDFPAAKSAVDTAVIVARRMKALAVQVQLQKLEREIVEKEKAFADIIAARKAVEKDPDDAQANWTLAIYHCSKQNNWDEGLTFLAKCDNQDLARVAERDLENPTDHQACYKLAETWWSLGEEDESELGKAFMRRAAHWYEAALPGLSALKKVKAQKRIEESSAP